MMFVYFMLIQIFTSVIGANKDNVKKCMQSLQIPYDTNGKPDEDNPSYNCIDKCVLQLDGRIDANGNINPWNFNLKCRFHISTCEARSPKIAKGNNCERYKQFHQCLNVMCNNIFHECAHNLGLPYGSYSIQFYPLTDKNRCLYRCVYRKYKITNEKDEIVWDEMKKYLKKNSVNESVKICTENNRQTDPCERVVEVVRCIHKMTSRTYTNYQISCMKEMKIETDSNGLPSMLDPKMKCLTRCAYRRMNILDNSGNFKIPNFKAQLYIPVKRCMKIVNFQDSCEQVETVSVCLWKEFKRMFEECGEMTHTTVPLWNTVITKPNEKYSCFYRCLYKAFHFVKENDEVDEEGLKMYFKEPKYIQSAVKICKEKSTQRDRCSRVSHMVYCLADYIKNRF